MPIEGGISVALSSLRTIFALRPEARLRKDLSGIARVIEQYPEGSEARKTLLSTADAIARELYDRQSSRVRRVLQPASLLLG